MALKFKRKKPGEVDIPVASFSDLAFLLIIFFIVATTLQKTTGITANIPSGEKSEQQAEKTTIININDKAILINDKNVTIDELRKELAALNLPQKEGEGKVVLLETKGNVVYQDYFEVMSSVSAAGGVIALVKEDKK